MIPRSDITDLERATFLEKLSASARSKDGVMLSPWELDFVASFNRAYRYWQWMTDGRRAACDELRAKFGHEPEIKMPFPLAESSPVKHAEADAGCCMFLIRDEGRQRPCNDPAAWQRQNGFRYCGAHADGVRRDLKRQGKTIHLLPFK
jgi:hypothetical protein